MNAKSKLFHDLTLFCKNNFTGRDYFALVYGSYASDDFTQKSDLDFFIATQKYNAVDFSRTRDFMIDLSTRNRLKINEEVPYENKLLVSYKDIKNALNLRAFVKKGKKYLIPPVTADKKFLASDEVRLRIILNALTSPHKYICGNRNKYIFYRQNAEGSILKLACALTINKDLSSDDILSILTKGANGEESGAYLGYRNHRPKVVTYLRRIISRNY